MPYTVELGNAICEGIAQGQSLRAVCKPEGMPAASTVCLWLSENSTFAEQYARARDAQADALAEEILEIADDGQNDWMSSNDPDNPGYKLNGEHVQRSKLRVEARRWFAGKVAPKKYGDRQIVDVGEDTLKAMSDETIQSRLAFLLGKAGTPDAS